MNKKLLFLEVLLLVLIGLFFYSFFAGWGLRDMVFLGFVVMLLGQVVFFVIADRRSIDPTGTLDRFVKDFSSTQRPWWAKDPK